ncbi:MAG: tRNA (adenosine(37)-N6)-dimethylallyltransferase MiaA [Limisphaerales bacterium]
MMENGGLKMANTPDHHPPHEPPGSAGVPPASREPKAGTRRRDASAPRDCAPVQGFKAQIRSGNSRPVLLAGPTATGKSEIALRLAEQLGGEIISADSMQVYRGLDIGTAKPSPADRARVPHHLVDILDLTESFDAAQFTRLAHRAVAEIQSCGHVPVLCGGTGLYFKAFLEGLGDAPSADAKLRAELETMPLEKLLAELCERDPAAYEKIDRQNPRRVIRAVEVIRLTGKPFSAQQSRWGEIPGKPWRALLRQCPDSPKKQGSDEALPSRNFFFVFTRSSSDLHARINARVDAMFRRGLVDETRELLKRGLAENKTAMQAIGYRQVVEHLRGERSLAETIELVKIRTRQFARRQLTWFRAQKNLEWIELQPDESLEHCVQKIREMI